MDSDLSKFLNAAAGGLVTGLAFGLVYGAVEFVRWLKSNLRGGPPDSERHTPPSAVVLFFVCAVGGFSSSIACAQDVVLNVGGASVRFSPITGWCVYPAATLSVVMEQYQRLEQPNVAHVFFGDCKQIEANTRNGTRIRDFGYLATPKKFIDVNVGNSRANVIMEMGRVLRTHDTNPAAMSMRDRLNNAEFDIHIGETRILGLIAEDGNAVYSGSLARLEVGSERFSQVAAWGITLVNGRIIFCYVYSDHKDQVTLNAVLSRAQSQIVRLVEMNP